MIANRAPLEAACAALDRVVAQAGIADARIVMDCLRLREGLAIGLPPSLSPLARGLATLDDDASGAAEVERALAVLEPSDASLLVRTADRYIRSRRARVLDDVLSTHGLLAGARLAALLALDAPDRCEPYLARVQAIEPEAHVDAVAAAYLALVDQGRPVPPTIVEQWSSIVDSPDAWPARSARFCARLRGLARRDAVGALPALAEAIADVGGGELAHAIMAVLSRAVAVEHAATWAFSADLAWLEPRALAIEALAVGAPRSPELDAAIEAVLATWRAGGWRVDTSELGAIQVSTPLLGACAVAGRHDLARRVIDTFALSVDDIAASAVAGARLRLVREGDWRPGLPSSELTNPTIAAIWIVETLPALELPWVEYADHA